MGRIRVLSDNVANKIAAGEVVERPASVVKELIENSFDAGATRVKIDVESGGRRLIRITDDGCGMLRDDALLAFERHATSKLSDVKDLLHISTLGFRGEALPSIASVSRLTLETRSPDEQTGITVEIAGGKVLRCDETALAQGTTITVRDLFFNVPARKKFLRSDQTELAHIASLATHYSLAYPERAIELTHDGNELLSVTPVDTIAERVFQVFGTQILADLIDLGIREHDTPPDAEPLEQGGASSPFVLRGFVSPPHVHKSNRNSTYLFVNGRLIRDRLLLHALTSAYHNLMPGNVFPFALLFLDCGYEEVDVNVHPSKTEVRFRRGTFVHDFVRDAVRQALLDARPVSNVPAGAFGAAGAPSPLQPAAALPYSEFSAALENAPFMPATTEMQPVMQPGFQGQPGELPTFTLRPQSPFVPSRLDFGNAPSYSSNLGNAVPTSYSAPYPHATSFPASAPLPSAPPVRTKLLPDTHGPLPEGVSSEMASSLDALRDMRPLGQLHDSFIIAAAADGLWVIDQHVAHERILFEQVLRQMAVNAVERQQLLMPIVLDLTPAQMVEFTRIEKELEASGFDAEAFGPRSIAIKAAPAALGAGDVERVVAEILEIAEHEMREVSFEALRRDMAASIACRAAIKINNPLDTRRMEWLLNELAACEYPTSCPHGRPIALRYPTREILKGFHRI